MGFKAKGLGFVGLGVYGNGTNDIRYTAAAALFWV